jgi:5-methylcytosine-specific restriction endonuclease McrA
LYTLKKTCTKCGIEKELSKFRKDKTRIDGYQSWCKLCAREQQKSGYTLKYGESSRLLASNRRLIFSAILEDYKKQHSCVVCGESTTVCLDFHHKVPSEKDFTISHMRNMSLTHLRAEISKCVVLCSNCHRKVHAGILVI